MTHGIIYYTGKKRIGKLQITRLCFHRMNQYGITTDELEEVFRYGRKVEEGRIELGQICLFYVLDETRLFRGNLEDNKFIIITCWKEVNKYYGSIGKYKYTNASQKNTTDLSKL